MAGLRGGVILLLIGLAPGTAARPAGPGACAPGVRDYTFGWWADGWRGRSPRHERVFCVRTGHYGLALDVEKVRLLALGRIAGVRSARVAVAEDNAVVLGLPGADLGLRVVGGGRAYSRASGAVETTDTADYPVRLIESGGLLQRVDLLRLVFADEDGNRLDAEGRLEVVA